ncbi:MAG: hypothetical protein FJZ95_04885 [Chloroflexi bacterium]|nr:hypothetical protein [Chloroflexota bacterium]
MKSPWKIAVLCLGMLASMLPFQGSASTAVIGVYITIVDSGSQGDEKTNDVVVWSTGAYANNEERSQILSIPGAEALSVSVTGVTEAGYDHIRLYDASGKEVRRFSGLIDATFTVVGSSIRARLTSDSSVTESGVTISVRAAAPREGGL